MSSPDTQPPLAQPATACALPLFAAARESYGRVQRRLGVFILAMGLIPLLVLSLLVALAVSRSFEAREAAGREERLLTMATALHGYFHDRLAAMRLLTEAHDPAWLARPEALATTREAFDLQFGGFQGLALLDGQGHTRTQAGVALLEKPPVDEAWFRTVRSQGLALGDVLPLGQQGAAFILAVRAGDNVLAAALDVAAVEAQLKALGPSPVEDVFVLNERDVIQTTSRTFGAPRSLANLPLPEAQAASLVETVDLKDGPATMVVSRLPHSPFLLVSLADTATARSAARGLLAPLLGGVLAAALVLLGVGAWRLSSRLMERIRRADEERLAAFCELEHSQKLTAVGRLASGVAHELNNPLAVINEKAGLIQDLLGVDGGVPLEKLRPLTAAILSQVVRCRTVTMRLLGFAQSMDVGFEAVDVAALAREVMAFLEKEAAFRNIRLAVHETPGLPKVSTDRGLLQLVILNLLSNALQAVADGGRIGLATRVVANALALEVSDNGQGMSQEAQAHLFEPFYATEDKPGSGGLGLSVAYGVLRKLGGRLEIRSAPGQGSTFTILLPVERDDRLKAAYTRFPDPT